MRDIGCRVCGCGKPLGNCTVMGQWAERGIAQGWLRPVSRQTVLEIKREAEARARRIITDDSPLVIA